MLYTGLRYLSLLLVYPGQNMVQEPPLVYNRKGANRESFPCLDHHFQIFHKSFRTEDWYARIYEGRETLHTKRNPVRNETLRQIQYCPYIFTI